MSGMSIGTEFAPLGFQPTRDDDDRLVGKGIVLQRRELLAFSLCNMHHTITALLVRLWSVGALMDSASLCGLPFSL